MKTTSKIITYSTKKVFTTMLAVIICSFLMYSFAIASTTVRVSDSNIMDGKIQELRTEIATLESSYYVMINDLSIEQAQAEGFIQDDNISFARVNEASFVAYNN